MQMRHALIKLIKGKAVLKVILTVNRKIKL